MEEWRPVPGYESLYEVSDLGSVRSLSRRVPCAKGTRISKGRFLKQAFPGVKYQGVTLYKYGVAKTFAVHRLVLLAFCGPPKDGQESCHYNGNCQDNRLLNLRWDSRSANRDDGKRLGEIARGSQRAFSKLSDSKVIKIRIAALMGRTQKAIAAEYGVSPMTIGKIVRREKWKHIL